MKKKVGIFGGSFDPIHNGHLRIARFLKEKGNLDEVLFIPAQISPFKTKAPPLAHCSHRLSMIELAIQFEAGMRALDLECRRAPPSYTIDTVLELGSDPSLQLFLLLSDHSMHDFSSWKEAESLSKLAFPLIADVQNESRFPYPCSRFPIEKMEISSTEIRERLVRGVDCSHLLPLSVLNYIFTNHLYGT